jgi:hypothetical protein
MLLISQRTTLRWALALTTLLVFACGSQTTPEERTARTIAAMSSLSHHVPVAVSNGQAALAGSLPADQELHVTISLPLRDQTGLTSLLSQIYDPSSSKYRQFLSVEQFTEQFGPTEEDFQTVVGFARANGMTVTDTPKNRLIVPLNATVDRIQKTFHVTMNSYRHPTESRTFFAPDREPSLNLSVPVAHISGLNNFSLPRPAAAAPYTNTGPYGSYLGSDLRAAYYENPSTSPPTPLTALTGSGQIVGLFEASGYYLSDVNQTFSTANQAYSVPIVNVLLDGQVPGPDGNTDVEDVLDIAAVIGMAPGLSQVRIYIGPAVDAFNKMATENLAKQISSSDGYDVDDSESLTEHAAFQEMAAQGQTIFFASGDGGGATSIDDTYVTVVGGTDLSPYVVGNPWPETAWARSSGGISPDGVPIPSWQVGAANSLNGASTTLRNVPDVAANADPGTGLYICETDPVGGFGCGPVGGTSLATPLWAGFMALVNQQAVEAGKSTVGFINPAIYAIYASGKGADYHNDFHDITSGNNDFFNAVPGYDPVTGLGSPNGQNLIDALAGPVASGFTLTNSNIATALPILPGGASGTTTITVNELGGFTGHVTLAASGLPSGVSASFGSNPTATSSALKLTATSTATAGTFTVTVTGTSGTQTASTSFILTVGAKSFSLSASSNFLVQAPGSSIADTIAVTDVNGFEGGVTLSASGLPSGVTASFSPNPTTTGSSVLTLAASASALQQTVQYNATVTGTSGTQTATTSVGVDVVPPFTFALRIDGTTSISLYPGTSSPNFDFTVVRNDGLSGIVNVSASGLPTGVTASLFCAPTATPGTTVCQISLTATSAALFGTFPFTIAATSGSVTASTAFAVTVVPNGTGAANVITPYIQVNGGALQETNAITLTGVSTVNLAPTPSAGGTWSWIEPDGSTFNQRVLDAIALPATTNTYVAIYTSPAGVQSVETFVVTIAGFTLSPSSSTLSIAPAGSASDTITVTSAEGPITLTATGLPSGVTAAYSANPTAGTSVLTLTANGEVVAGTYPVTLTGSSTTSTTATSAIRLIVETSDGGTDAGGDASADAASDATVASGCASGAKVISLSACGGTPPFNTTGPVCVKVKASAVNGWNASNIQGRTVVAEGASTQGPVAPTNYGGVPDQPGLSAGPDGFVYFDFTAGQVSYSTMACW